MKPMYKEPVVTLDIVDPPVPERRIRITLDVSVKEAQDLYMLSRSVGGDPYKSTRRVFDFLRAVLACGLDSASSERLDVTGKVSPIHFKSFE